MYLAVIVKLLIPIVRLFISKLVVILHLLVLLWKMNQVMITIENETVNQKIIDVEHKGMSDITLPFLDNEKRFFVRQQLFDNDAIVLKDVKSKTLSLKSLNHNKSLVFHMEGFNHLGIWAAKHVGGLIAIEPWVGHSDYVGFTGEFKDKEGVVSLNPSDIFECTFKVEINQ